MLVCVCVTLCVTLADEVESVTGTVVLYIPLSLCGSKGSSHNTSPNLICFLTTGALTHLNRLKSFLRVLQFLFLKYSSHHTVAMFCIILLAMGFGICMNDTNAAMITFTFKI